MVFSLGLILVVASCNLEYSRCLITVQPSNSLENQISANSDAELLARANSLYRDNLPEIARRFFLLKGKTATNKDLARLFDVSDDTIDRWIENRPEFREAVFAGREGADMEVVSSLWQRAVGTKIRSEKAFLDRSTGEIVKTTIEDEIPPDVNAIRFWLTNRQPEAWRERKEHELAGQLGIEHSISAKMNPEEAAQRYRALMQGVTVEGETDSDLPENDMDPADS